MLLTVVMGQDPSGHSDVGRRGQGHTQTSFLGVLSPAALLKPSCV